VKNRVSTRKVEPSLWSTQISVQNGGKNGGDIRGDILVRRRKHAAFTFQPSREGVLLEENAQDMGQKGLDDRGDAASARGLP